MRREGVIDPALDAISRESRRTIESHLADYENKLRAGGRSEQYIKEAKRYIREIAGSAKFVLAADIEPNSVNRYAATLKESNKSARTIQAHLTAIKGFSKWLSIHHKLPRDPLASVKKPNPEADRRRERRMLLPDEWQYLAATTAAGPERYGMTGIARILLYRTAIETGLRSNELRGLSRLSLVLDTSQPFVRAKAATTKNRKDSQQFIQRDLADQLRLHVARKMPTSHIFDLPDPTDMAVMLRDDLAAARREWLRECLNDLDTYILREQSDFLAEKDHDGKLLDFHSLRHTCGAWLSMTGAHPKVVQQVMRHSSITLTMDTYGHLFPGQEAEAIGRLRKFMGSTSDALSATGTEDLKPESRSAGRSALAAKRCVVDAVLSDDASKSTKKAPDGKPLELAALRDTVLSGTIPGYPFAPLAQLAEQLTLNQ